MGAARQPAHNVFGADDTEHECLGRAVERRERHRPAIAHQRGAGIEKQIHVGDMFDDFERQDDIECLACRDKVFGSRAAVIDLNAAARGVRAGRADVFFRCIDAGHVRAHTRQRFRYKPAAAADIQQHQPVERRERTRIAAEMRAKPVAEIAEPDRVEFVQRLELACRVPPFVGHRGKAGDFVGIDGCLRCLGCLHGLRLCCG